VNERFEVKCRIKQIVKKFVNGVHGGFADRVRYDIFQDECSGRSGCFEAGFSRLTKKRQLEAVAHQDPQLPDRQGSHKAYRDKLMLEQAGVPFGTLLVELFAANGHDVFRISQGIDAGLF
jgi:hypothetical protein